MSRAAGPSGHQGERGAVAITRGNGAEPAAGEDPYRYGAASPHGTSPVARIAAAGALLAALVLVGLVLFGNGSSYTLKARFQDAGGLVTGDDVLIGPARVGSVKSIGLSDNGGAEVVIGLNPDAAPMHDGTVARIYQNSLSGIANKYVVLEPGPGSAPKLPDGGQIPPDRAYSPVNLDQLFDTLDPATRKGLAGFIRGEAASVNGRAAQANQTLRFFAPALSSTSQVTSELARSEPAFDGLLVQGGQAMQALASRTQQLTQLIANTSATTAAIASQSQALERALSLAPGALTHSTRTFAGLRSTLDALDPLVNASKPASRRLGRFSTALNQFAQLSIPTVGALSALIHNPSGSGDLTTLLLATPGLARTAQTAFPRLVQAMNNSQTQVDYLREYAPDVVAALTDIGQTGAYYDVNGHYARTQPVFSAFARNAANQLTPKPAFERYQGLQVVHSRCPGGAVQPSADGSSPRAVAGCTTTSAPPGP
jgi:phospholipid/cholesterol/gamma-HCH transport system substrate-binding protein